MDSQTLQNIRWDGYFPAGLVVDHATGTIGRGDGLLHFLHESEGVLCVFNGHVCPHFDGLADEPVVEHVGV